MKINQLIHLIKDKLKKEITAESIVVEDKTYLHKKHKSHTKGKFHIKLIIQSVELKNIGRISYTKKIYKILNNELKEYIHSIVIKIL